LSKILFHFSLSLKKQRPFQKLHRKFDNKKRKERERERELKRREIETSLGLKRWKNSSNSKEAPSPFSQQPIFVHFNE
jgi:hypothetical protein